MDQSTYQSTYYEQEMAMAEEYVQHEEYLISLGCETYGKRNTIVFLEACEQDFVDSTTFEEEEETDDEGMWSSKGILW